MNNLQSILQNILLARIAAANALLVAAGAASTRLDSFGWWFLGATGAGLSLFISNLDKLQSFIPTSQVSSAAGLFIWAVIACVIQRYLSVVITGAAQVGKELSSTGESNANMDIEEFFTQMTLAYPRFMRPLLKEHFDSFLKGDIAFGGRMFLRLTLLQGIFVSVEVITLVVAISQILSKIQG